MSQYKNYVSDITLLIKELKHKNPLLEHEQRYGRALLWDKPPVQVTEKKIDKGSKEEQIPSLYTPTPDCNY